MKYLVISKFITCDAECLLISYVDIMIDTIGFWLEMSFISDDICYNRFGIATKKCFMSLLKKNYCMNPIEESTNVLSTEIYMMI